MSREKIYNVPDTYKPFEHYYTIFKSPKKGQISFRITKQLCQSLFKKASKIGKFGELVISIPANTKENYIFRGILSKEKK